MIEIVKIFCIFGIVGVMVVDIGCDCLVYLFIELGFLSDVVFFLGSFKVFELLDIW